MATDDPTDDPDDETEPFDASTDIDDDRTEIQITGDRSVAVVVRSESGERIYLPPEGFDRRPSEDSPYQSTREDSPYQSVPDDSPYQSARTSSRRRGASLTPDGLRIVHPEPATEITFFR